MNEIQEIQRWGEIAIQNPTPRNVCVQLGCCLEETSELAYSINDRHLGDIISEEADCYKKADDSCMNYINEICEKPRVEMLDAICDIFVTVVVLSQMMKFDLQGALREVIRSNYSKFENGQPVFDENGKIAKGKNYTPPQLEDYV